MYQYLDISNEEYSNYNIMRSKKILEKAKQQNLQGKKTNQKNDNDTMVVHKEGFKVVLDLKNIRSKNSK